MKYLITNISHPEYPTLKRIMAIASFAGGYVSSTNNSHFTFSVDKGEYGGFVENDDNLNQDDFSWIGKDAIVMGNAIVYGDSYVDGDSFINGNSYIFSSHLSTVTAIGDSSISHSVLKNTTVYGKINSIDVTSAFASIHVDGTLYAARSDFNSSFIKAKESSYVKNTAIIKSSIIGDFIKFSSSHIETSNVDVKSLICDQTSMNNSWAYGTLTIKNGNIVSTVIDSEQTNIEYSSISDCKLGNLAKTVANSKINNVEILSGYVIDALAKTKDDVYSTNEFTLYKNTKGKIVVCPPDANEADVVTGMFTILGENTK